MTDAVLEAARAFRSKRGAILCSLQRAGDDGTRAPHLKSRNSDKARDNLVPNREGILLTTRTIGRDWQHRLLLNALARQRLLARRARMRAQGHPRLAIIPDDEIGIEILQFGLYERRILSLLFERVFAPYRERFARSTALDVGANIGNHALFLSRRFRKVLAFEPGSIASLMLRANILLNRAANVEPLAAGLSDRDAQATLASSEADNLGSKTVAPAEAPAVDGEPVELRRGDGVLAGLGDLGSIALIKIDVEGHELKVLQGLAETLRAHRPIILFETAGKYGAEGSDEILAFLRGAGYRNFYTLAKDLPFPRWRSPPARAAIRALFGARYVLRQWEWLDDRFYNLAIATAGEELR